VVTSQNARAALQTFNATTCHVVLTDVAMPDEGVARSSAPSRGSTFRGRVVVVEVIEVRRDRHWIT
jgi:hypothetical protein